MWSKPWRFEEGFFIGAGLLVVGMVLQFAAGPVDWALFAFPVNVIALVLFLSVLLILFALEDRVYPFRWLGTYASAVPALSYALFLTIVMGLTHQSSRGGWLHDMLGFWPFVLVYVWMTVVTGLVALKHIFRLGRSWREVPVVLNHLGIFLVLVCGTLGNADIRRLQVTVPVGGTEWRGVDETGAVQEMDLAIELGSFTMDEYADGTPKRFASDVRVYTRDGKTVPGVVEVNKPLKVNGWKIYQYGYDEKMGKAGRISIFELVRDPWLPVVYAGIFLMLAGAFTLLFTGPSKRTRP